MDSNLPILIISAGNTYEEVRCKNGDFDDWIAASLGQDVKVDKLDAQATDTPLPEPHTLAGVIVTGSHAMVTEHAPWSERLADWLRSCVATQCPLLGICYGHQLIAYAMGGRVGYNPEGLEIGTCKITLHENAIDDALFGELPAHFPAQLVHAQSVLILPPDATLLASSRDQPHQAFRIGSSTWGLQFHPEFSLATMRAYIKAMHPSLAAAGLHDAHVESAVRETPAASALLERFAAIAQGKARRLSKD